MRIKNKKTIGNIVGIILLITFTIITISIFNTWYQTYSSNIYKNNEIKSSEITKNIKIEKLIKNDLYVYNNKGKILTIKSIKINEINCLERNYNLSKGLNKINISLCLINLTNGIKEITIITKKEIYTKKIYLNKKQINLAIDSNEQIWNTNFLNRIKITINKNLVFSDLNEFPIFLNLSRMPEDFFNNIKNANCSDIKIFNKLNDEMPLEIVNCNISNKKGELHFKADKIYNNTNTSFYIYFNNNEFLGYLPTDNFGANNVWSNNYLGVWHFNEEPATSEIIDSTINSNNAIGYGGFDSTELFNGKIGKALFFDGNSEYIQINNKDYFSNLNDFTISFIMYKTSNTESYPYPYFMWKGPWNTGYSNAYYKGLWHFRDDYIRLGLDNVGELNVGNPDTLHSQWIFWNHLRKSSLNQTKVYMNDNLISSTVINSNPNWGTNPFYIGTGEYKRFASIYLDEFRISNISRSQSWILTEYNNFFLQNEFYNIGDLETN